MDESFTLPVVERRNITLLPRFRWLQTWLKKPHPLKSLLRPLLPLGLRKRIVVRLRAWNQIKPPPLAPALRRELTEEYREDILKLQDLIGRDLSHWLA